MGGSLGIGGGVGMGDCMRTRGVGLCGDRGAPWGWGGCVRKGGLCRDTLPPPQGRTHPYVKDPPPPELLRLVFSALSFVSAPKPGPTPQNPA